MALKPLSEIYPGYGEIPQNYEPEPEKGIIERIKEDVVKAVSDWYEGAKQGYAEVKRAYEAYNQIAPLTSDEYLGLSAPQETPEQQAAREWVAKATKTFLDETVKPVAYAASLIAPALAVPFMVEDAVHSFKKGGIGQVIRDFTYGGAVDFLSQDNLAQKFHDRPVSTALEGVMSVVPAAIAGRAAYKGGKVAVTKAKELPNELVSRVEEKLNQRLNEVLPEEPIKAINGLDALDQYDSPTRGFRPATPEEMKAWEAEQRQKVGQGLVDAINSVAARKFDEAVQAQPEPRFTPDTPIGELPRETAGQYVKPLLQALEQVKAQKFDEANQQAYWDFMRREAERANAQDIQQSLVNALNSIAAKKFDEATNELIQRRKNQIASEALLSPVDRLEVGLDLPARRRIGGNGVVIGEQPYATEIVIPGMEKKAPAEIVLPVENEQVSQGFKTAEDLIGERQKRVLNEELKTAVKNKDFVRAAEVANQMGNAKLAEALRNSPQYAKNVRERITADEIDRKINYEKLPDEDKLVADLLEHHYNQSKVTANDLLNELKAERDRLLQEHINYLTRELNNQKPVKVVYEKEDGTKFSRNQSTKFEFARRLARSAGVKSWDSLSKRNKQALIEQAALDQLRHGYTDPLYGTIIPEEVADYFNRLEGTIKGIEKARERLARATNREIWSATGSSGKRHAEAVRQAAEDAKNIIGGFTWGQDWKLTFGFDPTGGRFDNMTVRDIIKGLKPEKKDRIIDNNDSKSKTPIRELIDKVYQRTIDSLHPIKKYSNEAYIDARLASGRAIGKAEEMLKRPDIETSFESIVAPVKNRLDDFAEYVAAVRAKELHEKGIPTGISNERINKIISEAPPEFVEAQKKLVAYSDRLLDVLVDGGILSPEQVAAMRAKYQNYAPMMRAFDANDIDEIFTQNGFDVRNPIKHIEGGNKKIINPLESIIKNTYTFHLLAEQNKVRQQIAKLAATHPEAVQPVEGAMPSAKNGVFTVYINGKKQAFQANPRLYEALASMDSTTASIVVKVLSKPASWLRAGATLSPEFLARNIIRDTINAAIVGKDFTPIIDTLRGLKSALKKDEYYWMYKREGGAMGHLTALDRDHLQEALNNYREKHGLQKLATQLNPKTWFEFLRRAQELSEDATRLGYFKKRLSKGDTPEVAAFEARDLLDFGRSGDYTREWNRMSAFLNASLQGTDKLIRSMRERPLETTANIIKYLILPSVVVWYMGKDDERIQRLPNWQKDLFWVIPAGDILIRIPKPFEAGVLFASGTERMLSGNFKGYGKSVFDVLVPNIAPTALIPIAEWWANKSLFSGHDIVPKSEQNLPDKLQYGPYTSKLARFIGDKLDVSPRKVDNTIRGYTGNLGTGALELGEIAKDFLFGSDESVKKPSRTLSEYPLVRGFIANSRKSTQPIQDFYDLFKEYQQMEAAAKVKKTKLSFKDKQNYETLQKAYKVMSELNKKEREILNSAKLSPKEKRRQIDIINDKQNELAEATLKRLKK